MEKREQKALRAWASQITAILDLLDHEEDKEKEDEEEGNEEGVLPEQMSLFMPSYLEPADQQRLGLQNFAKQELELWKGQASDALEGLRLALGHKALLLRAKVHLFPMDSFFITLRQVIGQDGAE